MDDKNQRGVIFEAPGKQEQPAPQPKPRTKDDAIKNKALEGKGLMLNVNTAMQKYFLTDHKQAIETKYNNTYSLSVKRNKDEVIKDMDNVIQFYNYNDSLQLTDEQGKALTLDANSLKIMGVLNTIWYLSQETGKAPVYSLNGVYKAITKNGKPNAARINNLLQDLHKIESRKVTIDYNQHINALANSNPAKYGTLKNNDMEYYKVTGRLINYNIISIKTKGDKEQRYIELVGAPLTYQIMKDTNQFSFIPVDVYALPGGEAKERIQMPLLTFISTCKHSKREKAQIKCERIILDFLKEECYFDPQDISKRKQRYIEYIFEVLKNCVDNGGYIKNFYFYDDDNEIILDYSKIIDISNRSSSDKDYINKITNTLSYARKFEFKL